MSRVAALWFPDWPVQAAALDDDSLRPPVAVARHHRIFSGPCRGMKVRQAQTVYPELTVVEYSEDRDGAMFAGIAASLDEVAASVEVLRPGLALVDVAAAGRFHGSEDKAIEMLLDAAARAGVDMSIGVADEIETARIAARYQKVVAPGGSREFLAPLPVELCDDPQIAQQFNRLGLRTLGEVARLPLRQVTTRFGPAGRRCHDIAVAAPDRLVAPQLPTTKLAVSMVLEEPITRVDTAAFAARKLASQLHGLLARAGVCCARLKIIADFTDGTRAERTWRTREALTEDGTANRVRWQLDGWVGTSEGISELILDPLETMPPGTWGEDDTAQRVIARVQSTLGVDAVLSPYDAGGRGVAERVEFVPFGEEPAPIVQGTWPGRIPAPLPGRAGGRVVQLLDAQERPVIVTAEALLSGIPHRVGRHRITAWAGPWPVDTNWWTDTPQRLARLQVVAGSHAWLLSWSGGQWKIEASYCECQ